MRRVSTLAAAVTLVAASAAAGGAPCSPLAVVTRERLLVVAPHPDDETLVAGGLVQRVLDRGGSVRVALVTAGDGYVAAVIRATGLSRPHPVQYIAYGERRLKEARGAMHVLGRGKIRLEVLAFPDGGLAQLLHAYWAQGHPEPSATTGARKPPYREALERGIAYDGADLRRELVHVLRETRPTMVVLPDPLDRHPDHRATGLFTLLALQSWSRDGVPMPRLLAYLVHWPDWPPGWNAPSPAPGAPVAALELPERLPLRGTDCTVLALTDAELRAKSDALARYASQQEATPYFLGAFVRRTEPFTIFTPRAVARVDQLVERHLLKLDRRRRGPPGTG